MKLDVSEILDEPAVLAFAFVGVRMPKKSRRVDGHEDRRGKGGAQNSSSHVIEPDRFPEDRLSRCHAKADDDARLDDLGLGFQPGAAGGDFSGGRFFVFAPLALGFPFEVLDRIRDIYLLPLNAGFRQRFVQNASRRSHEGTALHIFLIARLLAHEHDRRAGGSFPEDRLSGALVQVASRTSGCGFAQSRHAQLSGDE